MIALLRYQAAILLRSHRWIFPLIAYGLLVAVGGEGSTPLAEGLGWSAAMLVPVVALLTRSMLTAEPDAARAVVAAAAGPARAQLAALATALGFGAVLGLAGAAFDVLASESVARHPAGGALAKVTALTADPAVLVAGLAIALVCLLVGSAVGTLCNPPLLRHPAASLMSTLAVVVLALVSGVSPAAAALKDTAPQADQAALSVPHWPGVVPLVAAAGLLAVTWTASVLVASRRDSRGASPS
ncbi:MAG TPA: hypothetical protein VI365_03130 [Trebonia sp.]